MNSTNEPEARIDRALDDAELGGELVSTDLGALGALEASVDGKTATVTVTLPIPSTEVRSDLRRTIEAVVVNVDGISSVDVRFEPSAPDSGARVDFLPDVKNLVAVASGKGGVGKSTVATNLAAALANAGAAVGLLDADVYGPNAPTLLGLGNRSPDATPEDDIVPRDAHGVSVMSMEFIVGEDDPIIWRGPLVDEFIKQLFGDVEWGSLDYLVVDLPPGTGDAQLSLVQHLPVTGAVIVTTPQQVAVDDARRGLRGFARYDVPVLGIVENMAGFECPDCGNEHEIFGRGGAATLASEFDVPVLGRLPTDPAVGTLTDDAENSRPPGISVPGLGRLQLPRTRDERERSKRLPPVAIRDGAGEIRSATELAATRVAARVNQIVTERADAARGDVAHG